MALFGSLRSLEIFVIDLAGVRRYVHIGIEGIIPGEPMKKGADLFNAPRIILALLQILKGESKLVSTCF